MKLIYYYYHIFAAMMISDSGESWEEELLPQLRADMSRFMDDADGGGKKQSVQESIIVVSLNSITGTDSEQVNELFMHSGVFNEDQVLLESIAFWCGNL
jgi:hypothetical protein